MCVCVCVSVCVWLCVQSDGIKVRMCACGHDTVCGCVVGVWLRVCMCVAERDLREFTLHSISITSVCRRCIIIFKNATPLALLFDKSQAPL